MSSNTGNPSGNVPVGVCGLERDCPLDRVRRARERVAGFGFGDPERDRGLDRGRDLLGIVLYAN